MQEWEAREPLVRLRRYLEAKGLADDASDARIDAEVDAEVRAAVERAEARMREAHLTDMFDHVYGERPAEVEAQRRELTPRLQDLDREGRS